ncbi:O-antigen ligase family protein [Fulvivirgaceae bacterium PWU4]|uniref:O-antigen ligase family protein n=1 Tax=Chryseosolibacter histidini TaxID=2782349 RepID=A0AAP2GI34_9BACT|nr:O-antigen ligase family protein [Chryseosolibacter histidini]MBT1696714.1 O-antigen ligase family protein [Chryseosolibacter histidini]
MVIKSGSDPSQPTTRSEGSQRALIAIAVLFCLSLIFNLNGGFWSTLLNPCYQLVAILGITVLVRLWAREDIHVNMLDLSIIGLLACQFITRTLRLGYVPDLESLMLLQLILYYLAVRSIRWTTGNVSLYYSLVVATATGVCIYASLEFFGVAESQNASWPLTGNFSNPGPLAGFLSIVFPMAALMALQHYRCNRLQCVVFAGAALLFILVIFWCQSRAALLSLLLGIAVCIAALRFKAPRKRAFLLLIIPMMVLVIFSSTLDSAGGRLLVWKVSLQAFIKHPVLGSGHDFFRVDYPNYQAAYFASGTATPAEIWLAGDVDHAFNEGLKLVVENGIAGLALLMVSLLALMNILRQMQKDLIWISSIALLVAFGLFAQFSYPLYFLCIKLLLLNQVAIISANSRTSIFHIRNTPLAVLMVVIAGLTLFRSARTYVGTRYWREAHSFQYSDPTQAQVRFSLAHRYLSHDGQFLHAYGSFLYDTDLPRSIKLMEESLSTYTSRKTIERLAAAYEKLKRLPSAEAMYLKAHYMMPIRLRPQEDLMEFYFRTGRPERAAYWARHILVTPVKIQRYEARVIKQRVKKKLAALIRP